MPQWDFLSNLARKASAYSNLHLMMVYEATGLLEEDGRSTGVRLCDKDGNVSALKADLTIGADGRKSVVRREAHLDIRDLGSLVDVLWMRLSRQPSDPAQAMSHAGPSQELVMIDRGDYWQIGYVIPKGSFEGAKQGGLPALRLRLAALSPLPSDRFEELDRWDQVYLLEVRMDRLKHW